jgi:hypothetical protein
MRMSPYNLQNRYRRKANERLAGVTIVLIVLFLAFGLGFWIGQQASKQQVRYLKSEVEKVSVERDVLQTSVTELRAETQTALARYEQVQKTYEEVLPEGPLRELTTLLKQQLDEGRDPARLEFLIRSVRPPRGCSEPETKRFVVSNPAYKGPESEISIAEGALVMKASGSSMLNASGQAEAWYDPSKEVTFEFKTQEGAVESKTSVMPFNYSVVVGNREHRLAISEGAQSFAKVTFDSCDYP